MIDRFNKAISDLAEACAFSHEPPERASLCARQLIAAAAHVDAAACQQALFQLTNSLSRASLPQAAWVALACGALVERGANPYTVLDGVLRRLIEVLERVGPYLAQIQSEQVETVDGSIPSQPPDAAVWKQTVDYLCAAVIAMLSRSKAARRQMRDDGRLLALVETPVTQGAAILRSLLLTLDDENIVVLHPGTWRGYRLSVSGVADNFQLHTLLADTLIGDTAQGWLPGERPDPRIVAAARDQAADPQAPTAVGHFDMLSYPALQEDGAFSSDHNLWIWGEGCPFDIPRLDGQRVILLDAPSYVRTWNAGRKFSGMHAEVRLLAALDALAVKRWLERIASVNAGHMVRLAARTVEGLCTMAQSCINDEDLEWAWTAFDEALRLDPHSAFVYESRGNARSQLGDLPGAVEDYSQVLDLCPENADVYLKRGTLRGRLGDTQGALVDFDAVLRLDPQRVDAYINRGIERHQQGDSAGALADLSEALRLEPQSALAYANRAAVRCDIEDYASAIADCDAALRLKPDYASAYNNRAQARYKLGDYRQALADCDQAIRLRQHAYFHNTRGRVRAALQDYLGASQDFRLALSLMPDHPEADEMRARISEWGK